MRNALSERAGIRLRFVAAAMIALILASGFLGCSSGGDESVDVTQVKAGSAAAQYCSRTTKIVPCSADGNPIESYTVKLMRIDDESAVFPVMSVQGTSGFTINDFTGEPVDGGDKAVVVDGSYDVLITDTVNETSYDMRADYKYGADDAPARIEVLAS